MTRIRSLDDQDEIISWLLEGDVSIPISDLFAIFWEKKEQI